MKKIIPVFMIFFATIVSAQVSIGSGQDGSSFNSPPINPYYAYSYGQSIYLASEINASGDITSIAIQLNDGADISSADTMVDVWIGHTSKTSFSSSSDWVDVSTLTQVLSSGTITATNNVLTITFSNAFTYNGTDNIVIAIDANEPGFGTNSDYVVSTNGPNSNMSLMYRNDSTNPDPSAAPNGMRRNTRGNITFNGIAQACPLPTGITATANSTTEATITWTPGGSETNWTYEYGPTGFTQGSGTSASVTSTALNLNGLTEGTLYDIYIQSNCGGSGDSTWASPVTWRQPALGDSCDNPVIADVVVDCNAATHYTLEYASAVDLGTTDLSCDTYGVNTGVWFEFTAPTAGGVRVSFTDTNEYALFDSCGGTEIVCQNVVTNEGIFTGLTAGNIYKLAVWKDTASQGSSDICFEEFTPPAAPNCASNPSPGDMATNIPIGSTVLTWDAPTTGPTPTSYDLYSGVQSDGSDLSLVGNYTTTTANVTLNGYSTTIYWQIRPKNGVTEATGCPLWSLITEDAPPPPTNNMPSGALTLTLDDAATCGANTITGISNASTSDSGVAAPVCGSYGGSTAYGDLWYTFVAGASTVTFDTSNVNGLTSVAGAYYSGTVGSLTEEGCTEFSSGWPWELTGLTPGQTYYLRVWDYGNDQIGTFDLCGYYDGATASIDDLAIKGFLSSPNPVVDELNVSANSPIKSVEVFDILGKKLLSFQPKVSSATLSLSSLKRGVYIIKVGIDDKIGTYKIIKE